MEYTLFALLSAPPLLSETQLEELGEREVRGQQDLWLRDCHDHLDLDLRRPLALLRAGLLAHDQRRMFAHFCGAVERGVSSVAAWSMNAWEEHVTQQEQAAEDAAIATAGEEDDDAYDDGDEEAEARAAAAMDSHWRSMRNGFSACR